MSNAKAIYNAYNYVGVRATLTLDSQAIIDAKHVVFPGVGAFGPAMEYLKSLKLLDSVQKRIRNKSPILGVCLGFQMLTLGSEEFDGIPGVGHFEAFCKKLPAISQAVPHVGWEDVSVNKSSKLLEGVALDFAAYFSHSYYVPLIDAMTLATSTSDYIFSAIMERENVYGIQFHPERSQRVGLKILMNFLNC